jgi:membrane protease YdiL (CAAX protease family)
LKDGSAGGECSCFSINERNETLKEIGTDLSSRQESELKPSGDRAGRGWTRAERNHFLLWVVIALVIPSLLILAFHLEKSRPELTVGTELPVKGILAFFVALATVIVSRAEKRPLSDYGIPVRQAFGLMFWEGMLWGFGMLSLILLVLWMGGFFRVESIGIPKAQFFEWALGWGAAFLAVSLHEELTFRGYWLFVISRRVKFWRAAMILSVAFGVAHLGNHGETVIGIVHVFATGLLFCLMIRRTGNLWFAIGYHAAWDWAETFFYGTPDSGLLGVGRFLNSSVHGAGWITGGTAGPEGSVLSLVALLVCAGLIHLRFPKANYPDRPV